MEEMRKRLVRNKVILAVVSIAVGIMLLIMQRQALDLLIKIIGYIMLAGCVGSLLLFLFGKDRDGMQLTVAVLLGLIGCFFVWYSPSVVNFFPIMMGLCLILNGLSNASQAGSDRDGSKVPVIISVLTVILGALILFRPGFMANFVVILIGIAFIINGLNDLDMIRRYR